jgi:hypothetical protein
MAFFIAPSAYSNNGTGVYTANGSTFADKTFAGSTSDWTITGPLISNGIYVATGKSSSTTYYTSTDLQTWTSRTWSVGTSGVLTGDCDGIRFVFVAGSQSWYSTDGTTWTAGGTLSTSMPTGAAIGTNRTGRWVAMNQTNTSTVYSTDNGLTWNNGGTLASTGNTEMAWNGLYFLAYCATSLSRSTDGITWTTISPPGASSNFWGVGCKVVPGSGGTIVCVFTSGSAQYSTDNGTTWNSATMPYNVLWRDVSYDAVSGLFLAVEYTTTNSATHYATSSDGITWTGGTFSSGTYNLWYVYGQKVFGSLLTVNAGATATSTGTRSTVLSITYRPTIAAATPGSNASFSNTVTNTKLVSGHNGTTLEYTLNGTAYATATMPTAFYSKAYNGSYWIGLGIGTATVGKSTDGITWTNYSTAVSKNWYSIAYSPVANLFCGMAQTGEIYTSTDGVTWASRTPSIASQFWGAVTWGNGLFVAVSRTSANFSTSPDGITWTTRSSGVIAGTWNSVVWTGTAFVTFDQATTTRCLRSTDGITWSQVTMPSGAYWYSACNGSGTIIAVKDSSSTCAISTNHGVSFASQTMDGTSRRWIAGVAWNGVMFIAGVFSSTVVATSPDGITWTTRTGATSLGSNPMWSAWRLPSGTTFTQVVNAASTAIMSFLRQSNSKRLAVPTSAASKAWAVNNTKSASSASTSVKVIQAQPTKSAVSISTGYAAAILAIAIQYLTALATVASTATLTKFMYAIKSLLSTSTATKASNVSATKSLTVANTTTKQLTTRTTKLLASTNSATNAKVMQTAKIGSSAAIPILLKASTFTKFVTAASNAVFFSGATLTKFVNAMVSVGSVANIKRVINWTQSLAQPSIANSSKAALLNKNVVIANSTSFTRAMYATKNVVVNSTSTIKKAMNSVLSVIVTSTAFKSETFEMVIELLVASNASIQKAMTTTKSTVTTGLGSIVKLFAHAFDTVTSTTNAVYNQSINIITSALSIATAYKSDLFELVLDVTSSTIASLQKAVDIASRATVGSIVSAITRWITTAPVLIAFYVTIKDFITRGKVQVTNSSTLSVSDVPVYTTIQLPVVEKTTIRL